MFATHFHELTGLAETLPRLVNLTMRVTEFKGALAMSKRKVIVKRLAAIQNFGAMSILCTDKTGTLTEDQMIFGASFDALGQPVPRESS